MAVPPRSTPPEAAQRAFVRVPTREIVARMPQNRDAIADRGRQLEPFLVAASGFEGATGSEPLAPPGHKTMPLRRRGNGQETCVQRAGPQQRLFALLIGRGLQDMGGQHKVGAVGQRGLDFGQRRKKLDVRIKIINRLVREFLQKMPNDPRLQCKAKFGGRIAEPHVGKAAEGQLFGRDHKIIQILEHRRLPVGFESQHNQPRVGVERACGTGKGAALRRPIGCRYCDECCPPTGAAPGAHRRDLSVPAPVLRHQARKRAALVHSTPNPTEVRLPSHNQTSCGRGRQGVTRKPACELNPSFASIRLKRSIRSTPPSRTADPGLTGPGALVTDDDVPWRHPTTPPHSESVSAISRRRRRLGRGHPGPQRPVSPGASNSGGGSISLRRQKRALSRQPWGTAAPRRARRRYART
jgi:hypothetical protein